MIGQKSFFHGGVVPRDDKEKTLAEPIRNAALPNSAIVSLRQHKGSEAHPIVKEGDFVHESMCIATASGDGAAVHSPIPGIVGGFRDLELPDGSRERGIVINLVGSFERTGRVVQNHEWEQLSPQDLLNIIRDMGVVDMDASAIPTHLRLAAHIKKAPIRQIIINCMESEPYMSADFRLLMERAAALAEGMRIVKHITHASSLIVALSSTYRAALPLLRRELWGTSIRIDLLPAIYPQEDPRLLMQTLSRVDHVNANASLEAGILVLDIATIQAIYDAVVLRKPLMERIITVSGDAIARPGNIKVRIGTPVSWVLEECGGLTHVPDRIVSGGPFTGHTISDIDTPITKQTRMILALSAHEIGYAEERPCIRCGNCVRNCPVRLEPIRLAQLINLGRIKEAVAEGLMDCTECGICSYSCPSRVSLTGTLREGKKKAVDMGHASTV